MAIDIGTHMEFIHVAYNKVVIKGSQLHFVVEKSPLVM
jgi:hypothetical protein